MLQMRNILDGLTISKAITASCVKDFLAAMVVDAAIGSAGPASTATDTVYSTPGMRPIFSGILLSDKRAAELTPEIVPQLKVS